MKRRILSILTALCLALSLLPVTAWADGTTIYAGPNTSGTGDGTQANPYADLAMAIDAAAAGDTVMLTGDITISQQTNISENITLDLGAHTIIGQTTWPLVVTGTVTFQNGTIEASSCYGGIYVFGGSVTASNLFIDTSKSGGGAGNQGSSSGIYMSAGTFTLESDSRILSNEVGIFILNQSVANVYGSVKTISSFQNSSSGKNSGYAAIQGNGTNQTAPGTTINIYKGATVQTSGAGMGIYHPQVGTVNIYGGTVAGFTGIGMKSGKLNISGGSISGKKTTAYEEPVSATNGISSDGSAIIIDSYAGYAGNMDIVISGDSELNSNVGYAIREIGQNEGTNHLLSLQITGGGFSSGHEGSNIMVRETVKNRVSVSGGTFTADPTAYLAEGCIAKEVDGKFVVEEASYDSITVETDTAPAGEPETETGDAVDSNDVHDAGAAAGSIAETVTEGATSALQAAAESVDQSSKKDTAIAELDKAGIIEVTAEGTLDENTSVTIVTQPYFSVVATDYDVTDDSSTPNVITFDVTPMYRTIATTAEKPEDIVLEDGDGDKNAVELGQPQKLEITQPITMTLDLPAGFFTGEVTDETVAYVTHIKDDGQVYVYEADVTAKDEPETNGYTITFVNPHGFSILSVSSSEPVAMIGEDPYYSLQAAVDDAAPGETVRLIKNTQENVTIASGDNIVLELNGFTLDGGTASGKAALTNNGTVVIQDSSADGTGTIKRSDNGPTGCYYTIQNEGTMTIKSGNVNNNAGSETTWSGSSLICNGLNGKATLTIEGGNISQDNFIAVKNDENGTLKITGGVITSKTQAVQNWDEAEISNGKITGAVATWAYSDKDGKTTITGDAYIDGDVGVYWYGEGSGSLEVQDGTIPTTEITGGTVTGNFVKGSTTNGSDTKPVDSGDPTGDINVSGGSFANKVPAEYCADDFVPVTTVDDNGMYTVTEKAEDGAPTVTGLTLSSSSLSLQVGNTAQLTATATNSDNTSAAVTWTSGNTAIATVTNGRVVAVGVGTAKITVAAGNLTRSCTVTVYAADTPSYDGGSSSEPTYSNTLDVSDGGGIKVSPRAPEAGETVTITPTPEAGYDVGTVTVTDRNGREVEVTEHRNSTYTFTQPRGRVTIEVTFVRTGGTGLPFLDVAENAWYADAVAYVYENGLMSGTASNLFSPDATTTRAMIVTMLYRLEGEPEVNFGSSFNDVDASMYYAEPIAWASQNGIVTGYDETTFGPNDAITREQMAAILYRYAQYKGYDTAQGGMALREYEDYENISEYALEAMGWAVSQGLVTGTSSTTLTPEGSAIRAQVATIFQRFMEGVAE